MSKNKNMEPRALLPRPRVGLSHVGTLLAIMSLAACSQLSTREPLQAEASEPTAAAIDNPTAPLPGLCEADPAWLASLTVEVEPEPPAPPEPVDLLGRLRAGFSLETSSDPAVQRELDWYASHAEYLGRVFARAEPYLFHIAAQL